MRSIFLVGRHAVWGASMPCASIGTDESAIAAFGMERSANALSPARLSISGRSATGSTWLVNCLSFELSTSAAAAPATSDAS
jgi:hypothetical protein